MKARILLPLLFAAMWMPACGGTAHLSLIDLEEIVYREGDLPEYDSAPGIQQVNQEKEWKYDQWFQAQIGNSENGADLLADVVLFTDKRELAEAYAAFPDRELQGMPDYDPPDVGEIIKGKKQAGLPGHYVINWTFRRCYALVNIFFNVGGSSPLTEDGVLRYASALDERLVHSVCPI